MIAGDNMNDKVLEEITVGLSDAEKNDLEKMIKAFREKQPSAPETSVQDNDHKQMLSMGETLAHFGDVLLKFDTKIKLLRGILSLSDKKNRIMNQRIDAVIELLKEQKILSEKKIFGKTSTGR
jgi:hypothetical protein